MASLKISFNGIEKRIRINGNSERLFERRYKGESYKVYLREIVRERIAEIAGRLGISTAGVYYTYNKLLRSRIGKSMRDLHRKSLQERISHLDNSIPARLRLIFRVARKLGIVAQRIVTSNRKDKLTYLTTRILLNGWRCQIHYITKRFYNRGVPFANTTITPDSLKVVDFHIFVISAYEHKKARIFLIPSSHIRCESKNKTIYFRLGKKLKYRIHNRDNAITKQLIPFYEDNFEQILKGVR